MCKSHTSSVDYDSQRCQCSSKLLEKTLKFGKAMNLASIFKSSLLLHNWPQLVLTTLALMAIIKGCSMFAKRFVKKQRTETRQRLDGEEYVGADFSSNTADDSGADLPVFVPALEVKPLVPYRGATVTLPAGALQFYEMVNDRRSVRAFSRTPVPLAIIEDCVRAAGTAPSGAHTEPWTFCVVGSAALKRQIREIVEAEEELNYAQRMHRQWTADLRPLRTNHIKPYLTDAPHLILVFKQIYGLTDDGQRRQHYYNEISVAIATGVLLCALQAAGLSSLVTTPLNCGPALRALLERPTNEKLMVLLPVGYAAENCEVPDLRRKDLADIMVKY